MILLTLKRGPSSRLIFIIHFSSVLYPLVFDENAVMNHILNQKCIKAHNSAEMIVFCL